MTTELARMADGLSRSPSTRNIGTTAELSQNVATRVTKTAVLGGGRWRRGKSRTKTARAKKKARVVQQKKEGEGCKGALCCHTGVVDAGRPNPLQ